MRSPTLAIVSPSLEDGGTERYIRMLTVAAAQRGWNVVVAFPDRIATASLRAELVALGARTEALELGNFGSGGKVGVAWQIARNTRQTIRLLAEHGATSVMVVLPHPDLAPGAVLGAALRRIPSAVSVHLVRPDISISPLRRGLYTLSKRLGTRWITVSEDNRRVLARLFRWSSSDLGLVYYGLEDRALSDPPAQQRAHREVRSELGLPEHARVLLTVARLSPQKGHTTIIGSIPTILRARPDVWWIWVGDGESRDELEVALRQAGVVERVKVVGTRTDVPRLLAAADLFLFPTRFEGLGMAVLEAHLACLPVIATDVGPLPEIVRPGEDGLVVPPDDSQALAEAVLWAFGHPDEMRAMAQRGRVRVLRDFAVTRMRDQTFALLAPE